MIYFIIVVSNILIAVVFYLIISLKIEKSVKGYHSIKIKREMEEMIREFNATADRNISLLENKIITMKKILKTSGISKNIEFEITDKEKNNEFPAAIKKKEQDISILKNKKNDEKLDFNSIFKNSKKKLKKIFKSSDASNSLQQKKKNNLTVLNNNSIDFLVNEEIPMDQIKNINTEKEDLFPETDIAKLFENKNNHNQLVTELYIKGYSLEILSKYSGIPSGELKLILNLNNVF